MDNIRTLVVDDEKPGRARLLDLLQKEQDIEIVGVGRDGQEAVDLIRSSTPRLVFLDVQMPALDGFGVVRDITPERMPVTIFVTAYDSYAVQAFEAQAFDYLLKPFSDERFEAVLQRARKHILAQSTTEMSFRLAGLLQYAGASPDVPPHLDRIALRSNGRVTLLDVGDIDWIEAAGAYVYLHAGPRSHLYRATVGQIEQRLDPKRFVRVHRSTVVNTDRIKELQPRSHGDYMVILKGGKELTLSRSYRSQVEGWLRQSL